MNRSVLALMALALAGAAAARSPAPSPDCLDARLVEDFHAPSAWQLAVALSNGQRFRVELAEACESLLQAEAQPSLLAREGWACGEGALVQVQPGGETCGIAALAPVESREFARLAREASARRLATVEVRGRGRSGFGGSADFCFASRHLRAWNEVDGGLVVEASARRGGGRASYRVELDGSCSDLGRFENIDFASGANNGLICGNTGDTVIILPDDRADLAGMAASRLGSHCPIREVYPLAVSPG
ncbi:hypothetical protein [Aquimonas voraii]|uniref:Uncharacterized protein n=1 Tax=Aquimonas voraii TaxID=265719 RepID=A0A1G6U5G7_9GAMM|nr:hypothetical protein [Aquimonas voraii]SDD36543.1 hypothetical protein SAMN04488509_102173 [Aquimonas voraii]